MSRRRQVNRDMYLQCQACRQTTLSPGFAPFPNSRRCADSTSPLTIPPFSMLTPSGYPYVTFLVVPSSSPTTRSNVSFYVPNSCMYQGIPKRSCVRAFPFSPDLNSQFVTTTPCSTLPHIVRRPLAWGNFLWISSPLSSTQPGIRSQPRQ